MTKSLPERVVRVAVATERRPKVDAVRRAVSRIASVDPHSWSNVEIVTRSTDSGVRATPLSDDEMRRGARQRALALRDAFEPRSGALEGTQTQVDASGRHKTAGRTLFIGLEGGLHVEPHEESRFVWLRGWAFASDGRLEGWGCGPSIELPGHVADVVLDGEDLAAVIDRLSGETDVRSRGGTWGILTRGLLARAASFEAATLAALAVFYNPASFGSR